MIFISHATEDAPFAQTLAHALTQAGAQVWIAPNSIHAGEDFIAAIERGLGESTHIIVLLSPAALESKWVQMEMNAAIRLERQGRMQIAPIQYQTCEPPILWGNYHWLNYSGDVAALAFTVVNWAGILQARHWGEPRSLGTEERAQIEAELEHINGQIRACTACPLHAGRRHAVPGTGPAGARIMMVGEAPGPEDDQFGVPFVSAAGEQLDELLKIAGLPREYIYLSNVVKCRPNENRDPETAELRACAPYLKRQVDLVNPAVIVTLGRFAFEHFLPKRKLSEIHGQPQRVGDRLVIPMYHPAAALYRSRYRSLLMQAFAEMSRTLANPANWPG